jgi:hypothetical protein
VIVAFARQNEMHGKAGRGAGACRVDDRGEVVGCPEGPNKRDQKRIRRNVVSFASRVRVARRGIPARKIAERKHAIAGPPGSSGLFETPVQIRLRNRGDGVGRAENSPGAAEFEYQCEPGGRLERGWKRAEIQVGPQIADIDDNGNAALRGLGDGTLGELERGQAREDQVGLDLRADSFGVKGTRDRAVVHHATQRDVPVIARAGDEIQRQAVLHGYRSKAAEPRGLAHVIEIGCPPRHAVTATGERGRHQAAAERPESAVQHRQWLRGSNDPDVQRIDRTRRRRRIRFSEQCRHRGVVVE